uniref:Uncharacterized protein n=1 Tax=Globisporangium ultimum (strain ATCC 200006 / CBS 805.95 / DAOM BR144) TaxID=431595 RepID=K3XCF0_GLOUD
MKDMCVDTFEYESLCANVAERLQHICSQLQGFDSSRLQQEGSLVSFASIIFRYCRLLFDIKQRQRVLSRFIANRAITRRIKDFQEELDHFIDMLGLARNGTSWKELWNKDLSQLQSNFRDLLRSDDVLADGCDNNEVKNETAVLLQYELGLCIGDGEQAVRESIDGVLAQFLHACAIDAPVVPKWFISRDDVQFYSWNIVRLERWTKFYEGKWRNS